MLVLSRKRDEGITIAHPSGNVHIMVVEIRGDKVRLGIEAEKDVPVHRDEVWASIERDGSTTRLIGIDPDATDALLRRDGQIPPRCEDCNKTTNTPPAQSLTPEIRKARRETNE